jgi:hypothetical protein
MAVVVGAALVGSEITARQFYKASLVYDPEIGYLQAPGTVHWSSEAHATSVWTADGLRRRAPPRMDVPRVLVVGDSVTEALQVDDGLPFPDRLEAKIPELQFLNAGRSTMSTADYVAFGPLWIRRFSPTWTVIQVKDNDFTNDAFDPRDRSHFEMTGGALRLVPMVSPPVNRLDFQLEQRCMLLTLLHLRAAELRRSGKEMLRPHASAVTEPEPNYPVEEIVDLLASTYGGRMTIALVASYDPKEPSEATDVERRVLGHCRLRGYSCVSSREAYPEFQRQGTAPFGFPTTAFNVGHLNAEGHEAFAEIIAPEIRRTVLAKATTLNEPRASGP